MRDLVISPSDSSSFVLRNSVYIYRLLVARCFYKPLATVLKPCKRCSFVSIPALRRYAQQGAAYRLLIFLRYRITIIANVTASGPFNVPETISRPRSISSRVTTVVLVGVATFRHVLRMYELLSRST